MSFFKQIRRSSVARRVAAFFITQYVNFIWLTSKWEYIGKEHADLYWKENKPMIICFWHGRLLMMFKAWFGSHKLHMLISSHPDGEIIARTTQSFGYGWIAGSSTRGGRKALMDIIRTLKTGESIGVTPDGPRGPRYQASLGIIQMARLGKTAILPIAYSATKGRFMKSWDKFFLPFPFGKGVFMYAPLIEVVDSSKSDEDIRQELETALIRLTQKADLYCGREGVNFPLEKSS